MFTKAKKYIFVLLLLTHIKSNKDKIISRNKMQMKLI